MKVDWQNCSNKFQGNKVANYLSILHYTSISVHNNHEVQELCCFCLQWNKIASRYLFKLIFRLLENSEPVQTVCLDQPHCCLRWLTWGMSKWTQLPNGPGLLQRWESPPQKHLLWDGHSPLRSPIPLLWPVEWPEQVDLERSPVEVAICIKGFKAECLHTRE